MPVPGGRTRISLPLRAGVEVENGKLVQGRVR